MPNKKWNKDYLLISLYALGVILFGALFALLCMNISRVLTFLGDIVGTLRSILYGVILALFLAPAKHGFEHLLPRIFCRKKERPRLVKILSLVLVYVSLFAVIALVFTMIIPPMVETVTELRATIITSINSTKLWIESVVDGSSFLLTIYNTVASYINGFFSFDLSSLVSQVQFFGGQIIGQLSGIVVGLILSVYLLASPQYVRGICGKVLFAVCSKENGTKVAYFIRRFYTDLTQFFTARILSSLYVSSIIYLVCRLFNVPFYPLLFVIILILNIVPVVGPLASTVFCVTLIFFTARQFTLLLFFTIVATQIFEACFIEPVLLRKRLRIRVGTSLAVTLICYGIFGFLGALLAVPIWTTVREEVRHFSQKALKKKGLPLASSAYLTASPYFEMPQEHAPKKEKKQRALRKKKQSTTQTQAAQDADAAEKNES